MTIAISIINFRTGDLTIAAVASVLDDLGDRPGPVVVVDNASGDGSDDQIEAWIAERGDARVKLVRSDTNSGFSGGHNQGMAAAPDADFYLILNSDAVVRPGFFEAIETAAATNPEIGLIAPRLEDEDGTQQKSCFRFASPWSELMRGAASKPVARALKRHMVALDLPPDPDRIQWASFACILLNAQMVRDIGPMDEGYFLYFEDAEYSLRAARAGWGVVYAPEARCVHFRGGSGPVKEMQAAKKRMPDYYWRSRTRFFRQSLGVFGPFLVNLAWLTGRGIAQTRRLVGRKPRPTNEKAARDIWTGFFDPLRPTKAPKS